MAEVCSIRLNDGGEPSFNEGGHVALLGLLDVISSLVLVESPQAEVARSYGGFYDFTKPYPEKYDALCYRQAIRLAHFSVKEFLISTRLQQSDAGLSRYALSESQVHSSLSQSCCAYLLYFTKEPSVKIWIEDEETPWEGTNRDRYIQQAYLKKVTPAYPLLPYVCTQWTHHQRLAEIRKQQLQIHTSLHMRILADERLRVSWLRLIGGRFSNLANEQRWHSSQSRRNVLALRDWHDNTTSLYWAVDLGLQQTVSWICASASQQDVRATGGVYHTAAHCAAYCGDERILKRLMESGADVHCEGGIFRTTLQAATLSGNPKVVEVLLKNGVDVRCEGGHYGTAILAAVLGRHIDIVLQLLSADPGKSVLNLRSNGFGTALEVAASTGNEAIVEALLQAGADHGKAIWEAVQQGHMGVGRVLINHGANLDIDLDDFTVPATYKHGHLRLISFAVAYGSDEMVAMLTQAGADVTSLSEELLLSAAKRGKTKRFNTLVEAGAQIDPSFEDLLVGAAKGGAVSIVEQLLQAGFIVVGKHAPLIAAVEGGFEAMVKLLLKAGADIHGHSHYHIGNRGVNFPDAIGNALIAAAANGHEVILSLLLDAGVYADDEVCRETQWPSGYRYGDRGWSCKQVALLKAIEYWRYEKYGGNASRRCAIMIQKLIDAGTDIHTGNDAALHEVVRQGTEWRGPEPQREEGIMKLVQVLLTNGANIDAEDECPGFDIECRPSLLYTAVKTHYTKLVHLLVAHGADVNGYGWTIYSPKCFAEKGYPIDSIQYAERYDSILLCGIRTGYVEIVKLLLDMGADVKTLDTAEARNLIATAWKCHRYGKLQDPNRVAMLSVILDRMLEERGADDPIFDDDEGALWESLYRFSRYRERRPELLTEIRDLIRERRAVFMNK